MSQSMSLAARREMLFSIRQRYLSARRPEKSKIFDGFVAATGYDRKYALVLLRKKHAVIDSLSLKPKVRVGAQLYDEQFRHVLIKVWNTANQVCSKRFVPFIPDLVAAMERHGHLRISDNIRKKLMTVSAATVDRILKPERSRQAYGLSQTKAGALLKNKVQVRTFADWNDVIPGFFEDHYDQYQAEHGDVPELIEELMKNERFVLPRDASFYALYERRYEPYARHGEKPEQL